MLRDSSTVGFYRWHADELAALLLDLLLKLLDFLVNLGFLVIVGLRIPGNFDPHFVAVVEGHIVMDDILELIATRIQRVEVFLEFLSRSLVLLLQQALVQLPPQIALKGPVIARILFPWVHALGIAFMLGNVALARVPIVRLVRATRTR